jgi:hypothetical protein
MASSTITPFISTKLAFCSSFLTSPIVQIVVGEGENETLMTAHQSLLIEAPFLAEFVNKFEGSEVGTPP